MTGPDDAQMEDSVEPGSPTLEAVVFVVLGIATSIGVIVHLITLAG